MSYLSRQLSGQTDVAPDAGWTDAPARKGFFTDTSIRIGCKACEVACKEWNEVPDDGFGMLGMSYDNTGQLGANSWRHVAFIEQSRAVDLPMPTFGRPGDDRQDSGPSPAEAGSDVSLANAQQSVHFCAMPTLGSPSGPLRRSMTPYGQAATQ